MNKMNVSWERVLRMIDELADEINDKANQVHVILAPATGAWIPARIIRDKINADELYSILIGTKEVFTELPVNVEGKVVLIIDDIADSGKTLQILENICVDAEAKEVITATLFWKDTSIIIPRFKNTRVHPDIWVVFPWEGKEDTIRDRDIKSESK